MRHWIDPMDRGIYDHPAAPPPTPKPHHSNDLNARVAGLESHIHWSAWDRQRVETESRARAADIIRELEMVVGRISALETIIQPIERRGRAFALIQDLAGSVDRFAKTAIGVALIWAVLKGWLTPEQAKSLIP